jgi:hypothetical protein
MSPESRDLMVQITVRTGEFERGIAQLLLAFDQMAVTSRQAVAGFRHFSWWCDWTAFYTTTPDTTALIRRIEAVWR